VLPRLSQRATAFLRRVVALCFYSFVVFFEEPILSKRFGADYEQYCAAVPRWPVKRFGSGGVRSNGGTLTCSLIGVVWSLRPDDGSWMNREVHVQFWEGVGLRCPALLAYLVHGQAVSAR
jgi:hypothetical protein